MSTSTIIVGQRVTLNFDGEAPDMVDIYERVQKITKKRFSFCGGMTFYDGGDHCDGFVGVSVSQLYVSYEEAETSEVKLSKIKKAEKLFEEVLEDTPGLFVRLEKSFKGLEVTGDKGTFIVHNMDTQSAAELVQGITGSLTYDENFEWELTLHGKHEYDLDRIHEELKDEKYRPFPEDHEDYDEDFLQEDISNAKYNVVKLLEGIDAKVLDVYNEHSTCFDVLVGKTRACLLEGSSDERLNCFHLKPPGKLKEAGFHHFLETYG